MYVCKIYFDSLSYFYEISRGRFNYLHFLDEKTEAQKYYLWPCSQPIIKSEFRSSESYSFYFTILCLTNTVDIKYILNLKCSDEHILLFHGRT